MKTLFNLLRFWKKTPVEVKPRPLPAHMLRHFAAQDAGMFDLKKS